MSVMGIGTVSAVLGTHLNGIKPAAPRQPVVSLGAGGTSRGIHASRCASASTCGFALPRRLRACLVDRDWKRWLPKAATPTPRTSPASRPRQRPADASKDNQRKTDEFVEAQQAINGPAGNPECVWLGRRVVVLMWRDDLDTAFRHLDLYDRFGCPGGHVQAAFRCLTRFGTNRSQGPGQPDQPHPCLLDQSRGPAAGGRGRPSAAPRDRRQSAGSACRRDAACAGASRATPNNPSRDWNDRTINYSRFNMHRALKTPWRHNSC